MGGIRNGHSAEKSQLHQTALALIEGRQPGECFIEVDQVNFRRGIGRRQTAQGHAAAAGLSLVGVLVARVIGEDLPHGGGGDGEEMCPVLRGNHARPEQADAGLVGQGGRLQGVAFRLIPHVVAGKLAQLLVHHRQELIDGRGVPLDQPLERFGYFVIRHSAALSGASEALHRVYFSESCRFLRLDDPHNPPKGAGESGFFALNRRFRGFDDGVSLSAVCLLLEPTKVSIGGKSYSPLFGPC